MRTQEGQPAAGQGEEAEEALFAEDQEVHVVGESRGCLRKAAPAPSVSLPEDRANDALPSRCSGKPFKPTPVSGCSRHIAVAAAHIV